MAPRAAGTRASSNGQDNVRYRAGVKRTAVARLRQLIARRAPWLDVRYAF
ncbi:hypothetical protein [Blastococcus carthaginiensis]|nr:hypothetical protein [Blastococcus carthaginiensis]